MAGAYLQLCRVPRQTRRVGLLVTRRAEKRHAVTAIYFRVYCFDSYLIPLRIGAVILCRNLCACMETDEEGIFGRRLFQAV